MQLRSDGVSYREIDGETVILDLQSSQYLRVNRSGTVLLQSLRTPCTTEDLVAKLRAEFDLSDGEARTDVAEFVRLLTDQRLVIDA